MSTSSSSSSLDSCSKDSGGGDETTMTMNGAVESSAPSQDSSQPSEQCHLQTMALELAPPTLVKNTTRDETPPMKNISRVVQPHDGFITCPDHNTGRAPQKNVKKDSSQGYKLDEILAADDQNMGDCDEFNGPNQLLPHGASSKPPFPKASLSIKKNASVEPRTFTRPQYKTNEIVTELCNSLNDTRIRAFSKGSGDDEKPTKTNNNSKVELQAVMIGPSPQEVNKDLGAQKDSSDSSETSETTYENVDEYETCDTDESDDFYDAHDSEQVNPRGRASIIRNLEAFNAWLAQLSRSVAIRLWQRRGIPALISGRRGQRVIEGTRKLVKLVVMALFVKYYFVGFLTALFGDHLMNLISEPLQQFIHDCLADVASEVFYFLFGNRVARQ